MSPAFAAFLGLVTMATDAFAVCPAPAFTPAHAVHLDGEAVLLVTHASQGFDRNATSKAGINALVRSAKARDIDVVYFQEAEPYTAPNYFYDDCDPRYYVASSQGEFDFAVTPSHVISAGGFFELCKSRTVAQILGSWTAQDRQDDLRITEVLAASYQAQGYIRPDDPYYSSYQRLVAQSGSTTVNVLSVTGLMRSTSERVAYFTRYLDSLRDSFPPSHRVVIHWDGVLQLEYRRGEAAAPTLTIDFRTRPDALD